MVRKTRRYFTFFGILAATVNRKLQSFCCTINTINSIRLPKILKMLLSKQLKPVKLYSTNNI